MRIVLHELFSRARMASPAGLDQPRFSHLRRRIRRRQDLVRAMTVGAGGHTREAEFGDLAMERATERLDDVGVAGPAFGGDAQPPFVRVGARDRVGRMAIDAHRRVRRALLERCGMNAGAVLLEHARMTATARGRHSIAVDPARLLGVWRDVVFAMAIGTRRRADEPGLLLRPRMHAVVVLTGDILVTAAAGDPRELVWVRKFLAGIGVTIDAAERSVNRPVESPRVDGDRPTVRPFRISVTVTSETVVIGDRRWSRLADSRGHRDDARRCHTDTESNPHSGLLPAALLLQGAQVRHERIHVVLRQRVRFHFRLARRLGLGGHALCVSDPGADLVSRQFAGDAVERTFLVALIANRVAQRAFLVREQLLPLRPLRILRGGSRREASTQHRREQYRSHGRSLLDLLREQAGCRGETLKQYATTAGSAGFSAAPTFRERL